MNERNPDLPEWLTDEQRRIVEDAITLGRHAHEQRMFKHEAFMQRKRARREESREAQRLYAAYIAGMHERYGC